MAEVFVDTVAWLALINTSDTLHESAQQVMEQLRSQRARLTTTDFILLEVADALCASAVRERTIRFIDGLRQLPVLTIIPVSGELLAAGWTLYRQRGDKSWGLTDWTFDKVIDIRAGNGQDREGSTRENRIFVPNGAN